MKQKQPEKKKRGMRYVLVGGALGILLLLPCVGCTTLTPLPTATPNAEATEVAMARALQATMTALAPTVTNTPLSTDTPTPTNIPTQTAIQVSTPSATPTDILVSTPTLTDLAPPIRPEVQEYVSNVISILHSLLDGAETMARFIHPPDWARTAIWVNGICREWLTFSLAYTQISHINAPEEMSELHKMLIESIEDYEQVMNYLAQGHDSSTPCGQFMPSIDVETWERISEHLMAGNRELDKVIGMLPVDWKEYEHPMDEFTLRYPQEWKVVKPLAAADGVGVILGFRGGRITVTLIDKPFLGGIGEQESVNDLVREVLIAHSADRVEIISKGTWTNPISANFVEYYLPFSSTYGLGLPALFHGYEIGMLADEGRHWSLGISCYGSLRNYEIEWWKLMLASIRLIPKPGELESH